MEKEQIKLNNKRLIISNQLKNYSGPFACCIFLVSSLIFSFQDNDVAKSFGGLFFSLALILVLAKIIVIFCFPNNRILPRIEGSQKQEYAAIGLGLLTNIFGAIGSSVGSQVIKTLLGLFFCVAITAMIYSTVLISKQQLLKRSQSIVNKKLCSICVSIIRTIDKKIRLPCMHKFHDICFQGHEERKCPDCNQDF